jgi:hypothetical protein
MTGCTYKSTKENLDDLRTLFSRKGLPITFPITHNGIIHLCRTIGYALSLCHHGCALAAYRYWLVARPCHPRSSSQQTYIYMYPGNSIITSPLHARTGKISLEMDTLAVNVGDKSSKELRNNVTKALHNACPSNKACKAGSEDNFQVY